MTAQHTYLQYSLLSILSLLLIILLRGKKKERERERPSNIFLFLDNTRGHLRILMEMYSEINFSFMPSNTTTILQPMDQVVSLISKSYDLINIFL